MRSTRSFTSTVGTCAWVPAQSRCSRGSKMFPFLCQRMLASFARGLRDLVLDRRLGRRQQRDVVVGALGRPQALGDLAPVRDGEAHDRAYLRDRVVVDRG